MTNFWSVVRDLMRPHRRNLTWATCAAVAVGVAVAFQPFMVKFIVDEGINRDAPPAVRFRYALLYAGLYLGLSCFRLGVWTVGYRRLMRAVEGVLFSLRRDFFRHVQYLCLRFHDSVSSGELFNYLFGTPVSSIKSFFDAACMSLPFQTVSFLVVIATLTYFDWVMCLVTLVMVTIVVFLNRRSYKLIREYSADFMRTESEASKYIADLLRGTRAIKMYAIEDHMAASFDRRIGLIRIKGLHLAFRRQYEAIKPELVEYIGIAVIYVVGAFLCIYRGQTLGEFFAFVVSVGVLMDPMRTLLNINLTRANAEAGLERIERIRHVQSETPELPEDQRADVPAEAVRARQARVPCVEWQGVHFSYGSRPLFRGLDCRIEDGQSVALVGASGAGKTTFVHLMLRLYDPQEGAILLNGVDLRRYGLQDLRGHFGIVPQDPFLFQISIYDNVRVVRPEASEAEVRRAIENARVAEFAEALPQGWHTPLGEGGVNLSGGQRQRIAIARAVLAQPLYYIFDEATSALDNESERLIRQAMQNLMKSRTTFIIAHRLSTIRHVDRVLVFEDGRIVQDGRYDELARCEGPFQALLHSARE